MIHIEVSREENERIKKTAKLLNYRAKSEFLRREILTLCDTTIAINTAGKEAKKKGKINGLKR